MIFIIKHPIPNLSFLLEDGANLGIRSQFDAIFSNIVIHWVKPIQTLLTNLFDTQKLGGRILMAALYDDTGMGMDIATEIPDFADVAPKFQVSQIESYPPRIHYQGYYEDILSLVEFQAYQSRVNPNLTYKTYKLPESVALMEVAGFTAIRIEHQVYWQKLPGLPSYLEYRQASLWLYFLGYFPPQYRFQLVVKLCKLIQFEWDALPERQ
jgi:SAM-dependent methyltransferase